MQMSLFGALSELVGGAALTAAPACDLAISDGVIEDRAGFIAWIAQREDMREVRAIVEAMGREIWVGTETRGLAQRDLDQHIRAAAQIVAKLRPSAALIAEIAATTRSGKSAVSHSGETLARRIASDVVARARAGGAFAGGMTGVLTEIPLREEIILFLLDRAFSHLIDNDRRLMRLGPALAAFAETHLPAGEGRGETDELAGLGISRAFANQIAQAGGASFIAELAERFALSEKSVHRLIALVDSQALVAEGRIARLQTAAQWLADVRAQLMRPTNEDVETRKLKAAAASALADGDFERAMDTLRIIRRELRDRRRRTEERLQEEALALRSQMVEEARATARLAELLAARGEYAQAAELFAEAAIALGLLAVGAALKLRGAIGREGRAAAVYFLAVKLLAMPVIAWWVAQQLGLAGLHFDVALVFAALPTASSAYILAQRMGGDGPRVAWLISASTLLGMVTLPLWLAFLTA
jgi:tetratricopeptide (TPR) repeat protein